MVRAEFVVGVAVKQSALVASWQALCSTEDSNDARVFVPNDVVRQRLEFYAFFCKKNSHIVVSDDFRVENQLFCLLAAFGSAEIHIVRRIHPTDDLFTTRTSTSHLSNFWFSIQL